MHNFRLAALILLFAIFNLPARAADAPLETAFELTGIEGNPFDFEENDVLVHFQGPDGRIVAIPAFFDGGTTWKARLSPGKPGKYAVGKVSRNGKELKVAPKPAKFSVAKADGPGFVRIDAAGKRFVFEDGRVYDPLGVNLAWHNGNEPPLTEGVARIASLGGNWTRIWMTHFDYQNGMNLDWFPAKQPKLAELSLDVARRWDSVIAAAEKEGVYVQVVLQHHGQYSSRTNPNWPGNPWNKAAGGWLERPGDFFTDAKAIRLTKAKYRYIIARYGYSPHVLAWELFNEVEWTDPMSAKRPETVVAWHREMGQFLKAQDPQRHLVTTSATAEPRSLWSAMDFEQRHIYPVDILPAMAAIDAEAKTIDKPLFVGEFGPQDVENRSLREDCLHLGLWSSLMGSMPGAAQSWFWDDLGKENIVRHLRSAASIARESGLTNRAGLKPIEIAVTTDARSAFRFRPGTEWQTARQTEFAISTDGKIPGLSEMPRFLQGNAHRPMFPLAVFLADFPGPATFTVTVNTVAQGGGSLAVKIDGKAIERRDFPAASKDSSVNASVSIPIPAGRHAVSIENPGTDWVHIDQIAVDPFLPGVAATGKGSDSFAIAWVRRVDPGSAANARLSIPGLKPGAYRICWRDPIRGIPLIPDRVESISGPALTLQTPPIREDAVVFVSK